MSTNPTQRASRVPFSPLAHEELIRRGDDARQDIGFRVVNMWLSDDVANPLPFDVTFLSEKAAEAIGYHDAAMIRSGIGGAK